MPKSTQRRRKGHGEIVKPLNKLERIGELLQVQVETFPQKELTSEEIARWEADLSDYPIEAIEYAFDSHRRLAMFFPVPAQILDICKTWLPPHKYSPGCSAECKAQHGTSYGENDILYLWSLHSVKRAELNRPLTKLEWRCCTWNSTRSAEDHQCIGGP